MATNLQKKESVSSKAKPDISPAHWLTTLARHINGTQESRETRMRTMISCDIRDGKQTIYVPPDMTNLQPRARRYLDLLARTHDLELIEDRRRALIRPSNEKRNGATPVIAKALSELLKQLGMPGKSRPPSKPHRLSSDSQYISIEKLICMAAHARSNSKRVKVQPNRTLVDVLGDNKETVTAYACKLMSAESNTVLSLFETSQFRAIGYSAGKQYVMHVCAGGGSLANPSIWADFHTLTRCDYRFQLFSAEDPNKDVGLLFATYYLDVADAPTPWWMSAWADARLPFREENQRTLLKRAS